MNDPTKTCDICTRRRTPQELDYTPIQIFKGEPLGWYSGKDGEICPECMNKILENQ